MGKSRPAPRDPSRGHPPMPGERDWPEPVQAVSPARRAGSPQTCHFVIKLNWTCQLAYHRWTPCGENHSPAGHRNELRRDRGSGGARRSAGSGRDCFPTSPIHRWWSTGRMAASCPKSRHERMSSFWMASSGRALAEADIELSRCRRGRGHCRSRTDWRVIVGLTSAKALATGRGRSR